MTDTIAKCPPLAADKRAKPYRAPGKRDEKGDLVVGYDGREPEEVSVRGITDPETRARATAKRNANHCTVCRLHHRRHLNEPGGAALGDTRHKAAEQLQDDFALAGLSSIPSTLAALMTPGGGGNAACAIADAKIDASERLDGALDKVGKRGRMLLELVVLKDMTLGQAATIMQVHVKAALPLLVDALDVLAKHYKLNIEPRAKIRGGDALPIHPFHEDAA